MNLPPKRTKRPRVPPGNDRRRTVLPRTQNGNGSEQRIAKLLARAGVASRREIERMIAEGRIALHGEKLTTPATLLTDLTGVTVDGKPVRAASATRLFRFYKPQGTITAERDPKGRTTIYDRLTQLLNKGRGPSEAVDAKPTKEFDAQMGNGDEFVRRSFESLWAYLSPDA